MKIHRISPETLITLILAHLAGKADSTAKEEHRLLRRFLRDDDGRLARHTAEYCRNTSVQQGIKRPA